MFEVGESTKNQWVTVGKSSFGDIVLAARRLQAKDAQNCVRMTNFNKDAHSNLPSTTPAEQPKICLLLPFPTISGSLLPTVA